MQSCSPAECSRLMGLTPSQQSSSVRHFFISFSREKWKNSGKCHRVTSRTGILLIDEPQSKAVSPALLLQWVRPFPFPVLFVNQRFVLVLFYSCANIILQLSSSAFPVLSSMAVFRAHVSSQPFSSGKSFLSLTRGHALNRSTMSSSLLSKHQLQRWLPATCHSKSKC